MGVELLFAGFVGSFGSIGNVRNIGFVGSVGNVRNVGNVGLDGWDGRMSVKYKTAVVLWILFVCMITAGCEFPEVLGDLNFIKILSFTGEVADPVPSKEPMITSLGLTQEFDYAVAMPGTAIKVNQAGYRTDQSKMAVFEGEDLPDTFEVVNYDTGDVVYEGPIEKQGMNDLYDTYFCYGDFSSVQEEGTYCVRTNLIGYSYPFRIDDTVYDSLLKEAMKQYYFSRCGTSLAEEYAGKAARNACHTSLAKMQEDMSVTLDVTGGWHVDEKGNRSVVTGCDVMHQLLLAYEIHADVFDDEQQIPESGDGVPDVLNELQYEAAWLLKMQDPKSGGVYDGIRTTGSGNANTDSYVQAVSVQTSLCFASAMAKFSYLYQTYDTAYATICLKAADRAYRYANHYPDDEDQALLMRAAVELYRATGSHTYRRQAEAILHGLEKYDMTQDAMFTGCVTYLFTKQKVDTLLCEALIKELMGYVEDLSYEIRKAPYLAGKVGRQDNAAMLVDAARIAVVNYVITNNEYGRILENYANYLLGCNDQALCYVGRSGYKNAIDMDAKSTEKNMSIINQAESNSYWIILLSSVQGKE